MPNNKRPVSDSVPKPKLSKAAQRINDIGHLQDMDTLKAELKTVYGFDAPEAFVSGFAKFVKEMVKLAGNPDSE